MFKKYCKWGWEVVVVLGLLAGLWTSCVSSTPLFVWLSERGVIVNIIPWVFICVALVVHYLVHKPNLGAELIELIQSRGKSPFIYFCTIIVFLMMFCKGCNDSCRLAKYDQREKDGEMPLSSPEFLDTNSIAAINGVEIFKNDPWALGVQAEAYQSRKCHRLANYFFHMAEQGEITSTLDNKTMWRSLRPEYAVSLFAANQTTKAVGELNMILCDVSNSIVNPHFEAGRFIMRGNKLCPDVQQRIGVLRSSYPDETEQFNRDLEDILNRKN